MKTKPHSVLISRFLSVALLCGSALVLQGCMSQKAYQAQQEERKQSLAEARNFPLASPLYGRTKIAGVPAVVEITNVVTVAAPRVGANAELWAVSYSEKGEPSPIAKWADMRQVHGNVPDIRADGSQVTAPRVGTMLCTGNVSDATCNVVGALKGRVVAKGDGSAAQDGFTFRLGRGGNAETIRPIQQAEIAKATKDAKVAYERAQAQASQAKVNASQEQQRSEAARVNAWRNAAIGSVDFCQSASLVETGRPLGLGDTLHCNRGSTSIAELQNFGWEVTSTGRRPDTDFIGRSADDVSISVKKVRASKTKS